MKLIMAVTFAGLVLLTNAVSLASEKQSVESADPYLRQQLTEFLNENEDAPTEARKFNKIISSIRKNIREAIAELLFKALYYSKDVLDILRIKVLAKLSKVTVAHIFHALFEGVPGILDEIKPLKPVIKPPVKGTNNANGGLAQVLSFINKKPEQDKNTGVEDYSEIEEGDDEDYDENEPNDQPVSDSQSFLELLKDQYSRLLL